VSDANFAHFIKSGTTVGSPQANFLPTQQFSASTNVFIRQLSQNHFFSAHDCLAAGVNPERQQLQSVHFPRSGLRRIKE
jgi:hypothetical protein